MPSANLVSGTNRLKHAIQVLREQWQAAEPTWNDAVRQKFEEKYITPVEPAMDAALVGIQKLGEILDRVRRDCSDRSASS